MLRVRPQNQRRGAVLPFVILCAIALFTFAALAIDFGMMGVARTQVQNAADTAAMAGARVLNGDTVGDNNKSNAAPAAVTAATAHKILSKPIEAAKVTVEVGSYTYDTAQAKFAVQIPKAANDNYSLVRARVDATSATGFGKVLGLQWFDTSATATAVHRPRDVALVLDFSGSMRFDSLLGIPYTGNRTKSNNPEDVYPLFGHYSDTTTAALRNSAASTIISGHVYGSSNVTVETAAGPPIVEAFYQHAAGGTPTQAFTKAADSYAGTPGGDSPLRVGGATSGNYAKNVSDIVGGTDYNANWETNGYTEYTGQPFNGYTTGPRYWGKTFFLWPPDPRPEHDWRQKFFLKSDGTPLDDNTKLWDSSGNLRPPRDANGTNYKINYNAILNWLKNTGTNPFPSCLRAGRILYYDAIPDTFNTSTYPPTNLNERFWKGYIDNVLGVRQTAGGWTYPEYTVITPKTGYGDDFTWGTIQVMDKPTTGDPPKYMRYFDNPKRPKMHFWFGPMTLVDYLGNYNEGRYWWPGTCHEAPLNASKIGIQAALQDMKQNHPNDFVSTMMFSTPKYDSGDSNRFNSARGPLGRNYQRMIDALWYPPYTIDNPGTEIRPYDTANNREAPRAMGGTCPAMGFMLAYNQFSGNSSLRTFAPSPAPAGQEGGLGRRGAQKLIILETDGMANVLANADFDNYGAYNSYYRIRQPGEYPSDTGSSVTQQVYDVVDKICALDTAGGYSTTRKPVLIHCLAFGTLFEPTTSDPDKALALELLQTIQYKGKTQTTATAPLADYKRIIGTKQERIDKLRQAMSVIMQDGVQVSLIE